MRKLVTLKFKGGSPNTFWQRSLVGAPTKANMTTPLTSRFEVMKRVERSTFLRGAILLSSILTLTSCSASADTNAAVLDTNTVGTTAAVLNAAGTNNISDASATESRPTDGGTNTLSSDTDFADQGTNVVAEPLNIIAAIPPTPPPGVTLTRPVEEVIKLSQSDLSESVIVLFVEKSPENFDLSATDILYLRDIGISPEVLTAMLNHDGTTSPETEALVQNGASTNSLPATNAIVGLPQSGTPGAPGVEVSSNYVANTPPQETIPTVTGDPNAVVGVVQQPVIIQQQPSVIVTSPAVSYSYFYSSLSPYGTWIDVPDYGWCWQPSIAISYQGWRPYLHGGRWLYSTSGWYWQSDYSWGWAPFHYGRWFCAPRRGWVWIPDYTWGPSWVTWRRGPDYCGWAPLPPRTRFRPGIGFSYFGHDVGFNFSFGLSADHYSFVPTRHFVDRHLTSHVVPTGRGRGIYNNTTVINNYVVGNNNTIINNGVGRDYVERHTRTEIRQVKIENAPNTPGRHLPSDRIDRRNDSLVVYRPTPPSREMVQRHESIVRAESARSNVTPPPGTIIRPSSGVRTGSNIPTGRTPERQGSTPETRGTRSEGTRGSLSANSLPVWSKPEPVRVRPEAQASAASPIRSQLRPGTAVPAGGLQNQLNQLPSRPGVVTSPRGAAERQAEGYYQRPNVPTRNIPPAQNTPQVQRPQTPSTVPNTRVPTQSRPTINPTPGIRQPGSITSPSPSVRQPAISPAPSVNRPTINSAPSVRQPSVTPSPTPSVRQPSPAPAPTQRQPAVNPTRGRQESYNRPAQNLADQNVPIRTYTPPSANTPAPRVEAPVPSAITQPTRVAPSAPRVQTPAPQIPSASPQVQFSPRAQSFTAPQVNRAPVISAPSISRSAPAPVQSQPRSIQVPQAAPRVSTPSPAPAPRVNIQSAPIRGGAFNSAPSSAPAGRSIQSSPTRGDRRGER